MFNHDRHVIEKLDMTYCMSIHRYKCGLYLVRVVFFFSFGHTGYTWFRLYSVPSGRLDVHSVGRETKECILFLILKAQLCFIEIL